MKTLELNAYGVSEMNHQEMMNIEGGSLSSILCGIGKILSAIGETLQKIFCEACN